MKRIVVLLASVALAAAGLAVPAAGAQEAPAPIVPATVVLEDPFGDANALNDQGNGGVTGFQGDNATGNDLGNASDIGKVWFTDTATTISAHVQTELPVPGSQGLRYDVYTATGPDSALGCIRFVAVFQGIAQGQSTTWQGPTKAKFFDACNDGTNWFDSGVDATLATGALEDGTGYITITAPKETSPLVATGQKLGGTTVVSRALLGEEGSVNGSLAAPTIDNTKAGIEYAITGGGPVAPDPGKPTPPVKPTKPKPNKGKGPKGCEKGKGKKKGCPTPPPPAACPAFTPAEAGKDKPTITVTDAATEAAPLEQKVTLGESMADIPFVGGEAAHDAFNFQVDSAAAEAGVYVLLEFPARDDYDLNMMYSDGSYAARSRAWNTIIEANDTEIPEYGYLSSTGHGGESTASSEKLVGIKVADCSGWTMDVANYLGDGGELTVKLWLGEAKTDPQEQGAEPPA